MSEPTRDADAEWLRRITKDSFGVFFPARPITICGRDCERLRTIADRLDQPSVPAEVVKGLVEAVEGILEAVVTDNAGTLNDPFMYIWTKDWQPLKEQSGAALTAYEQWKAKHGT